VIEDIIHDKNTISDRRHLVEMKQVG